MMEMIIKISEKDYNDILNGETKASSLNYTIFHAIRNGILLPKGHGRLSDVDWVLNKMDTTDAQPITPNEHYAWDFAQTLFRNAPTIIEADSKNTQ